MITIEHGTYRFYSGDNVEYKDAATQWLMQCAVEADTPQMRNYAAAGLMRALLDTPKDGRGEAFMAAVNWASRTIMDVQAGQALLPVAEPEVEAYMRELPPVNGVFDAKSVVATEANKPSLTAEVLHTVFEGEIRRTDPKLVVAIGHSGVLSTLATYASLPGSNAFHAVRYRQHKGHDSEPVVSDTEMAWLREQAEDKTVIVHDEDRSFQGGRTIARVTRFMSDELGVPVYGITPVMARHPRSFWPEVVRKMPGQSELDYVEYAWGSDELKTIEDAMTAKTATHTL